MKNTQRPRFSVIIPAHNAAGTLPACLSSLSAQKLAREQFEIIVVDDRSTDRTRAVAEPCVERYVYGSFASVAAVRNAGARHARGTLLAFLDADVVADVRWLVSADHYCTLGGFRGVLGFADRPPSDAQWVGRTWNDPHRQRYSERREFDFLPSRNLIVPADLHHRMGGFDEALFAGGRAGEDKAYCYRFREAGYPVLCDPGLTMIHLGYEKDLVQFVCKEWWRQSNTLAIARAFGYPKRLLKNPLMSLMHLVAMGMILWPSRSESARPRALAAAFWTLPSLLLVLRRTDLRGGIRILPASWLLNWLRWNVAGIALLAQTGAACGRRLTKHIGRQRSLGTGN